jgi:hypothetical protein
MSQRGSEREVLDSSPGSSEIHPRMILTHRRDRVAEALRTLRGRNRALLVRSIDGRLFVQKFHNDASDSTLLFNEAFASQLGTVLNLSFPEWSELIEDSSLNGRTSFGSELIAGDILEYLPGGWYRNVQNGHDAYRCLLFDLWCNHADSRQTVFQMRSPRLLHAYFLDHDQMFAPDDDTSLVKRIARARCMDRRIYKQHDGTLFQDLRQFAHRITMLVKQRLLHKLENSVPATWGSIAHREQALSGLERRTGQLHSYIEAIAQFAASIEQTEST